MSLNNNSHTLLDAVTTTQASARHHINGPKATFSANGETSAGAGAATIIVEVSLVATPSTDVSGDGLADWITAGTITLTLATTMASDGFALDAPWRWARARLSAISGTGAAVSVLMGG